MQVLVHGRPMPPMRSRKALWTLALLALRQDRPVTREWIAGTLWPEIETSRGFTNLRIVLSELRQMLGEERGRLQSPNRYTLLLDLAGADIDLVRFDAALKSREPEDLKQAIALYRGPLLEGCNEEWALQDRLIREQECLHALETLGDAAVRRGELQSACEYFRRAIGIDPWREAAQRRLMEALAQSGERNAALQVYREFVELLRRDPTAVPSEETRALYARLRAEARRPLRAPVTPVVETIPATVIGSLPHPLTELIGREDECLEVFARLRRYRLVTLTGPGGMGKTRLAMEVAQASAREYPEGVRLVALEDVTEGGLLTSQIASVLGIREVSGRSWKEQVTEHIGDRRLLLVLDNCEHLLEDSAQLVGHLLRSCANLRVLTTSREALGIQGEVAWAVPTLATPDPNYLPPGDATLLRVLLGYESVQLFVARAQAVQQNFHLTAENGRTVAQICSRLEGIPLLIELAAARVRAMTVAQIAKRLDDPLNLLAGVRHTTLSRQQRMRAMLDWSYRLLSEQERLLLHRLSIFVGGWTLEAAEQVCAGEEIEAQAVPDLLMSLVDKSLVVFDEKTESGRYRLLEIVHQYAAEKLTASGIRERMQEKHRAWAVGLAGTINQVERTGLSRLQDLTVEYDNLRSALDRCEQNMPGTEAALRLADTLGWLLYRRGHYSEGRRYLERSLERAEGQVSTACAIALNTTGVLASSQSDWAAAKRLLEESLEMHRALENRASIATVAGNLATVSRYRGEYEAARALYAQSLAVHRETGDRWGEARTLNHLGSLAMEQSDLKAAHGWMAESLRLRQELDDRRGMAIVGNNLGMVKMQQGHYDQARVLFEESLYINRELNDRQGIAVSLSYLAVAAADQGRFDTALEFYEESLRLFQELGHRVGIAEMRLHRAMTAHRLGERTQTAALVEESLVLFRELSARPGIVLALRSLGGVTLAGGEPERAAALYGESLCLAMELKDKTGVAAGLEGMARAKLAQSEVQEAVCLWSVAAALRGSILVPMSPVAREEQDRLLAEARSLVGSVVFTAAWEEGGVLSWEQAVGALLAE